MKSNTSSLRWLPAVLLVPLLVLGVLAWLGTRAQVRAAWASARDEAKGAAGIAAVALARDLERAVTTVKVYPDPPVPGKWSTADEVLARDDLTSMRALRDDEDAGVSPAGLPRRVLAGLRVYAMSGEKADGERLFGIAVKEEPSVITPRVLKAIDTLDSGPWLINRPSIKEADWAGEDGPELWERMEQTDNDGTEFWAQSERARKVFRMHPEVDKKGAWISHSQGTWWLSEDVEGVRVISPDRLTLVLGISQRLLPAWAGLRFADAGQEAAGEVLAMAPVKFGGGGMLEIVAARPEMFEAAARQQARWTLGLLAVAVGISGGALWMIHRAVARERRLNALKSDFVASVSHELRAPVASIRLMADALGAGKLAPRTVAEFHGLISREGARLSALIENVLDFARIEQGRKRWDFESAELAPLVRESLELMAPLAAEREMRLVADEPLPELVADVDPGAIRQALVNLLDNAIKFSPPGTEVGIDLAERDGTWRLAISDQGPGIPAGERERVFERFHRLGGELRRETQGTGIGLSLVKAVAEAHGGRVELECEPGGGCVFTIIGPLGPTSPITP